MLIHLRLEVASSRFGNLLLFLPNILVRTSYYFINFTLSLKRCFQILGNVMYENLQFIQSFRKMDIGPLLSEVLDDSIGIPLTNKSNNGNKVSTNFRAFGNERY